MAITRTGVVISTNPTFGDSDDMDFYINGGQLGINQVPVSGLTPDTVYYAKGYVQQDGTTITDPSYTAFRTRSANFFHIKNEYAGNNTVTLMRMGYQFQLAPTIEISKDFVTWETLTFPLGSGGEIYNEVTLAQGECLYMRGQGGFNPTTGYNHLFIDASQNYSIAGDITSVFDYTDPTIDTLPAYACYALFYHSVTGNVYGSQTLLGADSSVFAKIKHLGQGALHSTFLMCSNFTYYNLDNVESISPGSAGAFVSTFAQTGITEFSLPNLSTISGYISSMFATVCADCTELVKVSIPKLTTAMNSLFDRAFENCTSLEEVDLSGLTSATNNPFNRTFNGCSSLKNVDISGITTINTGAFTETFLDCTALEEIDLSSITSIGTDGTQPFYKTFYRCSGLKRVYGPKVTTWDSNYVLNWFYGAGSQGSTYYKLSALNVTLNDLGLTSAWTIQDYQ